MLNTLHMGNLKKHRQFLKNLPYVIKEIKEI